MTAITRERIAEVMSTLPEHDGTPERASRIMSAMASHRDAGNWQLREVLAALGYRLGSLSYEGGEKREVLREDDGRAVAYVRAPADAWSWIRSLFQHEAT